MRIKRPTLVITFHTTTQAMAAEAFCLAQGLPGRLIPLPREITAGCGLAWAAPPEGREVLIPALEGEGLQWAAEQVITI